MVRTAGKPRAPSNRKVAPPKLLRFKKSNEFLKDYAHAKSCGRHDNALKELWSLLEVIRKKEPIPAQYECHPLQGEWKGWKDCHLEGDFVLIWKYQPVKDQDEVVILAACGTHAYLGI